LENQLKIIIKPYENNQWRLYVQSMAGENPVGERLSRSADFIVGRTCFDLLSAADDARQRLQAHLDAYYADRKRYRAATKARNV
jgi:hypothetical protein